jgi:hypothetical protein
MEEIHRVAYRARMARERERRNSKAREEQQSKGGKKQEKE